MLFRSICKTGCESMKPVLRQCLNYNEPVAKGFERRMIASQHGGVIPGNMQPNLGKNTGGSKNEGNSVHRNLFFAAAATATAASVLCAAAFIYETEYAAEPELPKCSIFDGVSPRDPYSPLPTSNVINSWLVLQMCRFAPIAPQVVAALETIGYLKLLRPTFMKHFCAGVTEEEAATVASEYAKRGQLSIFDVCIEADLDSESSHVSATNDSCKSTQRFKNSINTASMVPGCVVAVKLTAIFSPKLLLRLNTAIQSANFSRSGTIAGSFFIFFFKSYSCFFYLKRKVKFLSFPSPENSVGRSFLCCSLFVDSKIRTRLSLHLKTFQCYYIYNSLLFFFICIFTCVCRSLEIITWISKQSSLDSTKCWI
jgi:hypothetical protein